jgi:hypothetical protein
MLFSATRAGVYVPSLDDSDVRATGCKLSNPLERLFKYQDILLTVLNDVL